MRSQIGSTNIMINTSDLARLNKIARFCYREGAQFSYIYHKKPTHWTGKLQKGAKSLIVSTDQELSFVIRKISDWIDEQ